MLSESVEYNNAVEVLAAKILADYKFGDPALARRVGERMAEIIEQGGGALVEERFLPQPLDRQKVFARVMLGSSVIDNFNADQINAAIGVIEQRAADYTGERTGQDGWKA